MRSRILTKVALSCALMLTTAVIPPTVAAAGEDQFSPEPTPPETASPIASLELGCSTDQIDLNLAPANEIEGFLESLIPDEDKRQVAQRTVESRKPFFGSMDDLLLVNGIGPDTLTLINESNQACLSLPSTPPTIVPEQVCSVNDGRIDINRPENQDALARILGKPTSQRIVDAAPFTSVDYMVAERLPGSGAGRLKKNRDKFCYTPPTIDSESARWGWINQGASRVDHPKGASLVVPEAVLDEEGAWASIAPGEHDDYLSGQPFDLHIHGDWQGDDDVVYVILPEDDLSAEGTESWEQAVIHEKASGSNDIYLGDQVHHLGDGRISVPTTSLSMFIPLLTYTTFTYVSEKYFHNQREWVSNQVSEFLGVPRSTNSCSPDITDSPHGEIDVNGPSWILNGKAGYSAAGRTCIEGAYTDDHVTARITDQANIGVWVDKSSGPGEIESRSSTNESYLSRKIMEWNSLGATVLHGPGSEIDVGLPLSPEYTSLDFEIDLGATYVFFLFEALKVVDPTTISNAESCIKSLDLNQVTIGTLEDCAKSAGKALTLQGDALGATKLKKVGRLLKPLSIPNAADMVIDLFGAAGHDGDIGTLRLKYQAPPRPTDDQGRFIPDQCIQQIGATWDFDQSCVNRSYDPGGISNPAPGGGTNTAGGPDGTIVDDSSPDGKSILHSLGTSKDNGNTVYLSSSSTDGAWGLIPKNRTETYACLANRHVLRDNLPQSKVLDYHTFEISGSIILCDPSSPSMDKLPVNASNWILRERNGTAWFVDDQARLRWIPSGGTYNCLAQKYYVRDWTPWEDIEIFEQDAYPGDAACV